MCYNVYEYPSYKILQPLDFKVFKLKIVLIEAGPMADDEKVPLIWEFVTN